MRVKRPPLPPGLTLARDTARPPDIAAQVLEIRRNERAQVALDLETYAAKTRIPAEQPGLAVAAQIAGQEPTKEIK